MLRPQRPPISLWRPTLQGAAAFKLGTSPLVDLGGIEYAGSHDISLDAFIESTHAIGIIHFGSYNIDYLYHSMLWPQYTHHLVGIVCTTSNHQLHPQILFLM